MDIKNKIDFAIEKAKKDGWIILSGISPWLQFRNGKEPAGCNIMKKMLPGSDYLEIQSRYTCKFRDKRLSLQEQEIKSVKENNRSESS